MQLGTQRVNAKGHLEIGGCDTADLAAQFGTPLYVIDEKALRERCREYRQAFETRYPNSEICFAGKALLTTAICKIIEQEGLSLDVASAGELYTALKAGFPRERIALHGNNKSLEELEMAVEAGIGFINIDNLLEIDMLSEVAARHAKKVNVLLRVVPGVDPKTHKFIRTGQADTKFGLNIKSGAAMLGAQRVLESEWLILRGYHCHVGSQLLDFDSQVQGAKELVKFAKETHTKLNYAPEIINIGGGIGIRYTDGQTPPSLSEYADHLVETLLSNIKRARLPEPRLLQEPGRSIIGEAGITLYTIGCIKTVAIQEAPGYRMYVSIDGGLSDNPRPALYGAIYSCVVANKAGQPADNEVTVSGKHCETDTLIPDTRIAKPETGDLLAVLSTGAYNYSMSSNYNRFLRPAMVLVNDGRADLIVQRETLDDLVRNDVMPERLQALTPVR